MADPTEDVVDMFPDSPRCLSARSYFQGPPSFRLVHVKGDQLSTRVIHLHHENSDEF